MYHTIDETADVDYKGIRHYTHTVRVVSTAPTDPATVIATVPIARGNAWPTDSLARCKKASCRQDQDNNFCTWLVTYDYDNEPSDQNTISDDGTAPDSAPMDGSLETRPDLRPPTFTLGTEKYQIVMPKDVQNGEVVAASNGQPFDPPLMRTLYRSTITIKKFKALADDNLGNKLTYENKINNAIWWGIPAEAAYVSDYNLETVYEQDAYWWSKTVTIILDPDLWRIKILDAGTYEKYSADPAHPYRPILDNLGQPVSAPVPLNGSGRQLPPGDPFVYLSVTGYAQYNTVSFTGLI